MEKETTINFVHVIQSLISPVEFKVIRNELQALPDYHREAFWNVIAAGYSVDLAFKNCRNLYEFVKTDKIDYAVVLQMVRYINKGVNKGIYTKEITMQELN